MSVSNVRLGNFIWSKDIIRKKKNRVDGPLYKINKNDLISRHHNFNAFVWKRAPKDVFVGKMFLDMAVASAVIAFNDGATGYFSFLQKVGLHVGPL